MKIKLSIDCMGGDHSVRVTVPAAVDFVRNYPDAEIFLVGVEQDIQEQLKKYKAHNHSSLHIVAASEVVTMDDPIEVALRKKKDSSMRVALNYLKEGKVDACVSAGNTGALMAIARYVLKTIPGVDRPAIAVPMPNISGYTLMLDLGANVDCEPEHFLQFAEMGNAFISALDKKPRPSIGLLNIGEEVIKGSETIKKAGELLRASYLNFYGNVEGDDIYKGTVDVIVCDGFVGNVALKTSEGLVKMLSAVIKQELKRSIFSKFLGLLSLPLLLRLKKRFDPGQYNGAILIGLRQPVFKSHGSANIKSFEYAIERAYFSVKNGVLACLQQAFEANTQLTQYHLSRTSHSEMKPDSDG